MLNNEKIPTFLNRGPALLLRLVFFVFLSLTLLVIDARIHALEKIRESMSVLLYPLQWVATVPGRVVMASRDFLTRQHVLLKENQRLYRQNVLLQAKAVQLEQVKAENTILRKMLKLVESEKMTYVLAQVRSQRGDPFSDRLILERGEDAGIKVGQPVLDDSAALLGQVIRVQAFNSEIRLISDRDFPVPVMVVRNGLQAIIYGGSIPNTLEIRFLPFNSDIRVGDKLVTSGLDNVYPPGLPVATIKSIKTSRGSAFSDILCEPIAGPQAKHYALVVIRQKVPLELDGLTANTTHQEMGSE